MLNSTAQQIRINTAAHLANAKVAPASIVAYDYRLRDWSRVQNGGLTYAYDFAIVTNLAGEVVRARTLSSGALEICYCTPGAAPVWSANTVAITSVAGYGVALNGNGTDALECYYLHTDGVTVRRIVSADGGHTWGAAATVTALAAQTNFIYLASPVANMVFIGDGVSGDTIVQVAIYSGGAWTVTPWDFGGIALTGPVTIYGSGSSYTVPFAACALAGTNEYLLALWAKAPRALPNDGIYTTRVGNLAAGSSPHWRQLEALFATDPGLAKVDETVYPTLFVAFPRLQTVGSEYWLTALEISGYAGHNYQRLCYFRSTDGEKWTDRQYLGATDKYYDDVNAFTLNDLLHGQVVVSGNYIYQFAFDSIFRTDATLQCGVDNAAKRLDISAHVEFPIGIARSGGGNSAEVTLTVHNPSGIYTGSEILRKGSVIIVKTGYNTASGDETMDMVKLIVTNIEHDTHIGEADSENKMTVTCRDLLRMMQDDSNQPDITYDYPAPALTQLDSIPDLASLNKVNGDWQTSGGELMGGLIDASSEFTDNLAQVAQLKGTDGFCEVRFKCLGAWTSSYVYVALGIADGQHYYAVLYDGTNFSLYQATPSTGKKVTYTLVANLAGQTRQTAASLTVGTVYYLLVQQWHNRVRAYYSTNRTTWTKVIDYGPLPCDLTAFGVGQKGRVTASSPFGESHQPSDLGLQSTTYYLPLNDESPYDLGKAMRYFQRIKTSQSGALRALCAAISRWSFGDYLDYVPDVIFTVWADYGDGTKPASLTDPANKLYEAQLSPLDFAIQTANAVAWKTHTVDTDVPVAAETYYWLSVAASGDMTPVSGHLPATPNAVLYVPASHGGGFTCKFQYNIYGGGFDPATFYPASGGFNPAAIVSQSGTKPGGAGSTISMFLTTSYDASGIVIQGIRHGSGEPLRTIENIGTTLAVKSSVTGVLTAEVDSYINDAFASLDAGADGTAHNWENNPEGTWAVAAGELSGYHASASTWAFMRTNTYLGARGDGLIDVYLTILAASKRAGVLVRANGAPASFTAAYLIDVSTAATPLVSVSKIIAGAITLLYATPSMQPIPTNAKFKLSVLCNAGTIAVYVNDCLAAVFWDTTISAQGEVGVAVYENVGGGAAARFDDFRVPDCWKPVSHFTASEAASWQSALDSLIGNERIAYFIRTNGAFRMTSGVRRASVDTYTGVEITECTVIDDDQDWFSHVRPEGERFADRFEPILLESDWRRFRRMRYTDAATNEQAWDDGAVPLRQGREKARRYSFISRAVPGVEPEDVITVTDAQAGLTNELMIVENIDWNLDESEGGDALVFRQTLACRDFIS